MSRIVEIVPGGVIDRVLTTRAPVVAADLLSDGGFVPGRLEAALDAGAIGVASCRERVEAVGGSLLVESAPGAGTRAVARIPVGAPEVVGRSRLDEARDGA